MIPLIGLRAELLCVEELEAPVGGVPGLVPVRDHPESEGQHGAAHGPQHQTLARRALARPERLAAVTVHLQGGGLGAGVALRYHHVVCQAARVPVLCVPGCCRGRQCSARHGEVTDT